jgi:hypothetical protein
LDEDFVTVLDEHPNAPRVDADTVLACLDFRRNTNNHGLPSSGPAAE